MGDLLGLMFLVAMIDVCASRVAALEETKAEDEENPITNIVNDLKLGKDFLNACRLLPIVELAPMVMLEDVLKRNKISNHKQLNEAAKSLFFKLMLEGSAFAICLFTVDFGQEVAKNLLEIWLKEYRDTELRASKEKNMKAALKLGIYSRNARECRKQTIGGIRVHFIDSPPLADIQSNIDYVSNRLRNSSVPARNLVPAMESITTKCLRSLELREWQRDRIPLIMETASLFYQQLISTVLAKIVGERINRDVVLELWKGTTSAHFLGKLEMDRRLSVLSAAILQARNCALALTEDDCISLADLNAVEDTLSPQLQSEDALSTLKQKINSIE